MEKRRSQAKEYSYEGIMHNFMVRLRGKRKFMCIVAEDVQKARMKAHMLLESRKMPLIRVQVMPGSISKSRRLLRGKE